MQLRLSATVYKDFLTASLTLTDEGIFKTKEEAQLIMVTLISTLKKMLEVPEAQFLDPVSVSGKSEARPPLSKNPPKSKLGGTAQPALKGKEVGEEGGIRTLKIHLGRILFSFKLFNNDGYWVGF